jgi:2-methylcitrate dehydratase PrpD
VSRSAALGALAERIDEARAPEAVRVRLRAVIADVLAAAIASSGRPDVAAARSALLAGTGPSTVIGGTSGAAPALAALVNALPIAAEQNQDGHRAARGHPGSHVVPAVLAVAEAVGASGAATLSAVLAGYEVGVRVGITMGGTPPGVHDIATWGTVGAAAGVAHLLAAGDGAAVAAAVDLAAGAPVLPSAQVVFSGASGQLLFLGLGAQSGVLWGQASAAGLRPLPGALERHFLRWSAAPDTGSPRAPDGEAQEWTILDGYLKRHPTCAHLHGVQDAVEDLAAQRPVVAEEIAAVEVRTYPQAAAFDMPRPANDFAARFSIPWAVAAGLCASGDGFGAEALADPRLQELATRVTVVADPELAGGYPAGRPAVVSMRLRDGSVHRADAARPRGDGRAALEDPQVRAKPARLIAGRWGQARAAAVLASVDRLAEGGLAPLTVALRGEGPGRPRREVDTAPTGATEAEDRT